MKNKVFIGIAIAVVALAIAGFSIFLIVTKDAKPADTTFKLEGTWKAYDGSYTNDEYFVFTKTEVKVYNEGESEPYMTKEYTFTKGQPSRLVVESLGLDLIVEIPGAPKYNQVVKLYNEATESNFRTLVKINDTGSLEIPAITNFDAIKGTWNAQVFKGKAPISKTTLAVGDSTLSITGDMVVPNLSYTVENGMLKFGGASYDIVILTNKFCVLVDISSTLPFILTK